MIADIIEFQKYVDSKKEERERIKKASILSTKCKNIEGLLHSINSCVGYSFITRHFGEMNQIIGRENVIDSDMLNVIIDSLREYSNKLHEQINELNSYGVQTSTTC